jgi:hypothetical protein
MCIDSGGQRAYKMILNLILKIKSLPWPAERKWMLQAREQRVGKGVR